MDAYTEIARLLGLRRRAPDPGVILTGDRSQVDARRRTPHFNAGRPTTFR